MEMASQFLWVDLYMHPTWLVLSPGSLTLSLLLFKNFRFSYIFLETCLFTFVSVLNLILILEQSLEAELHLDSSQLCDEDISYVNFSPLNVLWSWLNLLICNYHSTGLMGLRCLLKNNY